MIVSNHRRMFGFGHFGVVKNPAFGCAVSTAPEGLFKGYSTVFLAFEGEWAGVPKTKTRIIAKAFLHPRFSKKQAAEVHDAFLKRLDELGSSGRPGPFQPLADAIDEALTKATEEGVIVDSVTERALQVAEAFQSALEEASRPRGKWKSARLGAQIRSRLISLIEKFEAENNCQGWAVGVAEGVMFVDPKLVEFIRSQDDADGIPGEMLEVSLASAFPRADATRRVNEEWPSTIAHYHGRPNTESLLREKAIVLSEFVTNNLNIATTYYAGLRGEKPEKPALTDEQEAAAAQLGWHTTFSGAWDNGISLRLEEAVVWFMFVLNRVLYVANRTPAFSGLSTQRPDWYFLDWFLDRLAHTLALQGTPPDVICKTFDERMVEYKDYELFPSEGEGLRGTLIWEAAKRHLSIGLDPLFAIWFVDEFLRLGVQAKIVELLTGEEAAPRSSSGADDGDKGEQK